MDGFDILGAVTIGEARRDAAVSKAKSAGQRAVTAGQRIARRAPRLSRSMVAAGQKALNAGKMGPASKKKTVTTPGKAAGVAVVPKGNLALGPGGRALMPVATPKGTVYLPVSGKLATGVIGPQWAPKKTIGPMGPIVTSSPKFQPRPAAGPQMAPTKGPAGLLLQPRGPAGASSRPQGPTQTAAGPQMAPGGGAGLAGPGSKLSRQLSGRTILGADTPPPDTDLRDLSIYTGLAEALERLGGLVFDLQSYIDLMPADLPLVGEGTAQINMLQDSYGTTIDKAISGESPSAADAEWVIQGTQTLMSHRDDQLHGKPPQLPMFRWLERADAWLRINDRSKWENLHKEQDTADDKPADDGTPPPGTAAKVVINPISISVALGVPQQFAVQATDSTGNPVSPKTPAVLSVQPPTGATIDGGGKFTATTPGVYTITATVDGVSGTATAEVQGATDRTTDPAYTPPPTPPSGGGYDGSGITAGPDPGYADPYADAYAEDGGYGDPFAYGDYAAEGAMTPFYGYTDEGFDDWGDFEDDPRFAMSEPFADGAQEGLYESEPFADGDQEGLYEDSDAGDGAYLEGDFFEGEDLIGDESGGWGAMLGPILAAAGGIATAGIAVHEKNAAQKKAAADEQTKLQEAITADVNASNAAARAAVSATLKSPSAAIDASAAEAAGRAQDRAGAALSPDVSAKRVAAAQKALDTAVAAAAANPKDGWKRAVQIAWTTTANKALGVQIMNADRPREGAGVPAPMPTGDSWLTRPVAVPVVGPVPGYGVVIGGGVVVGSLALAARALMGR